MHMSNLLNSKEKIKCKGSFILYLLFLRLCTNDWSKWCWKTLSRYGSSTRRCMYTFFTFFNRNFQGSYLSVLLNNTTFDLKISKQCVQTINEWRMPKRSANVVPFSNPYKDALFKKINLIELFHNFLPFNLFLLLLVFFFPYLVSCGKELAGNAKRKKISKNIIFVFYLLLWT